MSKVITYDDLVEAAESKKLSSFISEMFSDGSLSRELPELFVLSKFKQNPIFHPEGNPLVHTIKAIKVGETQGYSSMTLLGTLFHDIGKGLSDNTVDIRKTGTDEQLKLLEESGLNINQVYPYNIFWRHEELGVEPFNCIAYRLNIPNEDYSTIGMCIRYHRYLHKMLQIKHPKKVAKLVYHKNWNILKEVFYCDLACRGKAFDPKFYTDCIETAEHFKGIEEFKNIYHDKDTSYDEFGVAL